MAKKLSFIELTEWNMSKHSVKNEYITNPTHGSKLYIATNLLKDCVISSAFFSLVAPKQVGMQKVAVNSEVIEVCTRIDIQGFANFALVQESTETIIKLIEQYESINRS